MFCRQAYQLLESVLGVKVFHLRHTSTADGTSKTCPMAVDREFGSSSFCEQFNNFSFAHLASLLELTRLHFVVA